MSLLFCIALVISGLDSSYPSLVKERRPECLQASCARFSRLMATSVCPSFLKEEKMRCNTEKGESTTQGSKYYTPFDFSILWGISTVIVLAQVMWSQSWLLFLLHSLSSCRTLLSKEAEQEEAGHLGCSGGNQKRAETIQSRPIRPRILLSWFASE